MNIQIIASDSKGNATLISDGYTNILLDAGIPYSKLSKAVKLSKVDGVLISHEHADHCKAVYELLRRGTNVYMSYGTRKALMAFNAVTVKHLEQFHIGTFTVLPFDLVHDVAEPLGFLLYSNKTKKKAVYIVDSGYVNYEFKGITHFLVEANYREDMLAKSDYHEAVKSRIRKNHFSIDSLKQFFKESDLSKAEAIYLLHLSSANSDESVFVREIEQTAGVPVYIQTNGQ